MSDKYDLFELVSPEETASMLHVSKATLAIWRSTKRYDLDYVKIGRKVFYQAKDINDFIKSRIVVCPEVDPNRWK